MDTILIVTKFVNELLKRTPIAVVDEGELKLWIILTSVKVFDSGMIQLTDEMDHNWYIGDGSFRFFTMDEYNDICRAAAGR